MTGLWLRSAHGYPGMWIIAAAVGVTVTLLGEESCREKVIGDDDGIDACTGFERAAYDSTELVLLAIVAAAFLGYTLLRIAQGVEDRP